MSGHADTPSAGPSGAIGVFVVDARLAIRAWDDWIAGVSGVPAADARGRPLVDIVPSVAERGLLPRFEQVLASGEVQVLAPAFHHYLIPCRPAAPSPHFDLMQQRVTLGALREDERIAGVMVTIEDVTARLDAERELAARLRSPDAAVREAASREIAAASSIEGPQAFTDALGADDWHVRRAAVAGLAPHAHRDMLASLLTSLRDEHHDFNVLSSALQLLATWDLDVTAPLVELLHDRDPNLRMQAALALGEQQHPAAIEALIDALADDDVNVRFHAIEALGRLRAAEAAEALAGVAERGDFFLAFPAIDALGRINDGRVAVRLVPLLGHEEIRDAVAEALGELGGAETVAPLVHALNRGGHAAAAARALSRLHARYEERYNGGAYVVSQFLDALEPPGAQRIVDAVDAAGADDLPALVRVLGWLRGPAVERALTRLLGRPSIRGEVIEAVVRQDAGVVDLLVEQLAADDSDTRLAAVAALGRLGDRRAAPALAGLLDGDRATVIAAAGALAAIGDARAFDALLPLLAHADASVRQAAIGALNSLGHPQMAARVQALLDSDDPLSRESAVRIAGYFGYRDSVDAVVARCTDPVESVRRAALEQLPHLDDPRGGQVLAAALAGDTPKARAAAAQALARMPPEAAVMPLVAATRDGDAWVRFYAARSLGELGAAAALPALASLARGDGATQVRLAALAALGAIDAPDAAAVLLAAADDDNPDVAAAALKSLGQTSNPRGASALKEAIRSIAATRRLAAVHGLGARASADAVDALQWTAVADDDDRVGRAAVQALADFGRGRDELADAAVDALVTVTADPARRDPAIAAIAGLPARRIPRVVRGLNDPRVPVRRAIVDVLGRMKHPDASAALNSALDDDDASVREAAVTTLDRLGAHGVARRFAVIARQDPSRLVRRAAAAALGRHAADVDPDALG